MSSCEQVLKNENKIPKAPRPKLDKIPRKISYMELIEVDDDSDSQSSQNITVPQNKVKLSGKKPLNDSFDDDRYEDSFDEEFGQSETNPDSGKLNINNY